MVIEITAYCNRQKAITLFSILDIVDFIASWLLSMKNKVSSSLFSTSPLQ